MKIKYAHTNLIAEDWKKLSLFYIDVFGCKPKPPERNLSGKWLEELTSLPDAELKGIHLQFPGYGDEGPTLEIFEFRKNLKNENKNINKEGYAHIAFAVEDVELCFDMVKKHGGSAAGEIIITEIEGVGKLHVVYARDPEGNIIEIQKWN